ncbi:hypothetical protein DNH61_18990 [Paenibacillus sambharensis]|uniref:Uncharacterized protein n=1 Tax=Paenibacillus sambharensis TaxID=1803190 RepID=A0A2W1L6M4_9BACL|nr:hypothetical protein [Paenibacillus sambharensis]PZD94479.1 hypothetical protein DNH61_18990 [Paenibacillus sambharensis]
MRQFKCLDLTGCMNNRGITTIDKRDKGEINASGCSFPAEELPLGEVFVVDDVPFLMGRGGDFDNVVPEGQIIEFPESELAVIHVLGASNDGNMMEPLALLRHREWIHEEPLRLSYFIPQTPFATNRAAITMSCLHSNGGPLPQYKPILWYEAVAVELPCAVDGMKLADNLCMHIFAITIEERQRADRQSDSGIME